MEKDFAEHNRSFDQMLYLYPVISRRSRGLSLGINLHVNKVCNFDCPYCQVDRQTMPDTKVDFERLCAEIRDSLDLIHNQKIWELPRFKLTRPELKVFKDIAIAGDGEPSVSEHLLPLLNYLHHLKPVQSFPELVIISNATGFQRTKTQKALEVLSSMGGCVWAKLDCGTQKTFEIVSGSKKRLKDIVRNIQSVPQTTRVKIQTCLMKIEGVSPSSEEIKSYCDRIREICSVRPIEEIQVYTIARPPAQSFVAPLQLTEMKEICRPLADLHLPFTLYSGAAD